MVHCNHSGSPGGQVLVPQAYFPAADEAEDVLQNPGVMDGDVPYNASVALHFLLHIQWLPESG